MQQQQLQQQQQVSKKNRRRCRRPVTLSLPPTDLPTYPPITHDNKNK
jgi:hypothetical protein